MKDWRLHTWWYEEKRVIKMPLVKATPDLAPSKRQLVVVKPRKMHMIDRGRSGYIFIYIQ